MIERFITRFASRLTQYCLIPVVATLGACAGVDHEGGSSRELRALLTQATQPGQWRSISADTLRFDGVIGAPAAQTFRQQLTPAITTVVINSSGGLVPQAAEIATEIHGRHLKVQVNGYCLSACANYILPAAAHVELRPGLAGFHGDITGCIDASGGFDAYVRKSLHGVTGKAAVTRMEYEVNDALAAEARFYNLLEMTPTLQSTYCKRDKGIGSGIEYSFIAPSRAHLLQLGISGITGEQSIALAQEFGRQLPPPIFVEPETNGR